MVYKIKLYYNRYLYYVFLLIIITIICTNRQLIIACNSYLIETVLILILKLNQNFNTDIIIKIDNKTVEQTIVRNLLVD